MVSIVVGVMCAFCYLFGVWVGRNKLKSNASQRIQSVESVENNGDIIVRSNLEPFRVADTPQTDCDTCKYAQIADEHCELCGEADIYNYEPQMEDWKKEMLEDDIRADCPWK